MKTIAIIVEQLSERALAAVLPTTGVASVSIHTDLSRPGEDVVQNFHGFRNPARFRPGVGIELVVDDYVVDTVFDGLSFAYGAGLFGDAEAWVSAPAQALAA